MEQDEKAKSKPEDFFAGWIQSVSEFWLSAAQAGPFPGFKVPEPMQAFPGEHFTRMEDGFQRLLKIWRISSSALATPQVLETLLKGMTASPDAALKIIRTTWEGYYQLYKIWKEKTGKAGETGKVQDFQGGQPESFKEWTAFYEKEIRPLLKMPQVGLTRIYQERANDAVDKFARYQAAVAEFLSMLAGPVEKSIQAMEEKLSEMSGEGKQPEDFKEYYNMWIKVLEGHYMALYRTPEYVDCLGKALNAVQDYQAAREKVLIDLLQVLPVPTRRDMDDLYKEFYTLKKKVKEMAKRIEKLEAST